MKSFFATALIATMVFGVKLAQEAEAPSTTQEAPPRDQEERDTSRRLVEDLEDLELDTVFDFTDANGDGLVDRKESHDAIDRFEEAGYLTAEDAREAKAEVDAELGTISLEDAYEE
jgi:hypothetical protein